MLHRDYLRLVTVCEALDVELLTPETRPAGSWIRADRLADAAEALIAGEAARIAARWGVRPRPHVAAARLLHHYLWSTCLLISGPWYLAGMVPRLDPEDVWIEPATGRFAVRPGRWSPGDASDVRDAVVEHAGPALEAFQNYARRGPHALWGMAADDLVSGIWYLGRMLGEEDRAVNVATAVLPGDTPPFPGTADFRRVTRAESGECWTRTRRGCCLYYAIDPPNPCLTCPRLATKAELAATA